MTKERLQYLLSQYLNNTISKSDCMELLGYLSRTDNKEISDIIDQQMTEFDVGPEFSGIQARDVFDRILSDPRLINNESSLITEDYEPKRVNLYQKKWFRIAAVFLIFCITGLYFLKTKNVSLPQERVVQKESTPGISPDRNKATLTLSTGEVISLEGAKNGELANSANSSVQKIDNGQIVYNSLHHSSKTSAMNEPVFHTLTTPKGGEYQITLPDGTKVWLNSYSSLSFPDAFLGNERRVKLNGEAYFEVAKNKDKPFNVSVNDVTVRVLGTHFNISAYRDDRDITTTLLEGSVQVAKNNKQTLIKPGQQATVQGTSDVIAVSEARIKEVMAWKNGYFIFNDEDIFSIMKQVSRWYDVDVEYKGNFGDQRFGGTFYRSKSINELLHHLERIGKIHFKIDEGRIIVME